MEEVIFINIVAMIQARCGSTRLPNKVLLDLNGKPVLQRVIERVKMSKKVSEVMVLTSIEKDNLPILGLCAQLGVRCFVGSENDVLDRFYQAAKLVKPDLVVRVTADCPLYDAALLDEAFSHMSDHCDYVGQLSKETYPDGLDIEMFTFEALKKSWEEAKLLSEREHVTQFIRKHPELFRLHDLRCPYGDFGSERWTLDEPEDYAFISAVYQHFGKNGQFYMQDVIEFLKVNSSLRELNAVFIRNEGLITSLANDGILQKDVKNG